MILDVQNYSDYSPKFVLKIMRDAGRAFHANNIARLPFLEGRILCHAINMTFS